MDSLTTYLADSPAVEDGAIDAHSHDDLMRLLDRAVESGRAPALKAMAYDPRFEQGNMPVQRFIKT